jgi:hypothetical protein
MKTGRRAAKAGGDDGFKMRTVAAMVAEMVSLKRATERACIQFETLAAEYGVRVDWDEPAAN